MKKEYRKVVTLDEADIERANELRKALFTLFNNKKLKEQMADEDEQIIHNAIYYFEELGSEYYD